MEFSFVIFHTNLVLYDKNVKNFSKLVYIAIIHTFTSYYIDDINLLDYLSDLFGVSKRSIYRAMNDLIDYNYICKENLYRWRLKDLRFDYD